MVNFFSKPIFETHCLGDFHPLAHLGDFACPLFEDTSVFEAFNVMSPKNRKSTKHLWIH